MVPPLELMGKLELPLGFCEDLLCNVAQAVGEGKEMDKGRRGLEMERMMSFGNILDGDSGVVQTILK